jgi:hypothetical protein
VQSGAPIFTNRAQVAGIMSKTSAEPVFGIVLTPPGQQQVPEGAAMDYFVPEFAEIEKICAGLKRPAVVPLGVMRVADLNDPMLDRFLGRYLQAEVLRRVKEGSLDASSLPVPVHQALVALPQNEGDPFRVYLNAEVKVLGYVHTKYGLVNEGDPLGLDNVMDLREVSFRDVDITTQPFAWLRQTKDGFVVYFSFIPATPRVYEALGHADRSEDPERWKAWRDSIVRTVQNAIGQDVLRDWFERALPDDAGVRDAMRNDGWFPAPTLLPQPWGKMCAAYAHGRPGEATELAIAALSEARVRSMLSAWVSREPFAGDRAFLEHAAERYFAGDYLSAVAVALPRIEGLVNRARSTSGIGATSKFSKVFTELERLGDPELSAGWLMGRIREGFLDVIDAFFDAHFAPTDPNASSTRGRHAHAHGATRHEEYDARYAAQVLLMVDALFFFTTPARPSGQPGSSEA